MSMPYYAEAGDQQTAYYQPQQQYSAAAYENHNRQFSAASLPATNGYYYSPAPAPAGFDQPASLHRRVKSVMNQQTPPTSPPAGLVGIAVKAKKRKVSATAKPGSEELTCEHCLEQFERRCDLTKHRKSHDRKFKCDDEKCIFFTRGFASDKDLGRHCWERHGRAPAMFPDFPKPPLQYCDEPGCNYFCKRASNLATHKQSRHGVPYIRVKGEYKGRIKPSDKVVPGREKRMKSPELLIPVMPGRVSKLPRAAAVAANNAIRQSARIEAAVGALIDGYTHPRLPHPDATQAYLPSPSQSPKPPAHQASYSIDSARLYGHVLGSAAAGSAGAQATAGPLQGALPSLAPYLPPTVNSYSSGPAYQYQQAALPSIFPPSVPSGYSHAHNSSVILDSNDVVLYQQQQQQQQSHHSHQQHQLHQQYQQQPHYPQHQQYQQHQQYSHQPYPHPQQTKPVTYPAPPTPPEDTYNKPNPYEHSMFPQSVMARSSVNAPQPTDQAGQTGRTTQQYSGSRNGSYDANSDSDYQNQKYVSLDSLIDQHNRPGAIYTPPSEEEKIDYRLLQAPNGQIVQSGSSADGQAGSQQYAAASGPSDHGSASGPDNASKPEGENGLYSDLLGMNKIY